MITLDTYQEVVRRSGLVPQGDLERIATSVRKTGTSDPLVLAKELVKADLITPWQNDKLLQGKHQGFVLGKYKLLGHISSGGMSSVYLAEHILMQRRVAVKVLPPAKIGDSSYLERFQLECRVMAALDHPNIVRAHDFDVEGKLHYLVMEYIEGPDIEKVTKDQFPVPYEKIADYMRQACLGLHHAHQNGMIHRDMKPANLLLDPRGVIKVLDLGVARITGQDDAKSLTLAHKEDVVGTADFLAPEQAINSHQVDFRADIYGLGCTMYYALTGHVPFPGGNMAQKLMAHQTQEPAPVLKDRPDCPPGILAILERAMAKKLKKRYQNMLDLAADLQRWLDDHSYVPDFSQIREDDHPATPQASVVRKPSPQVSKPAAPTVTSSKSDTNLTDLSELDVTENVDYEMVDLPETSGILTDVSPFTAKSPSKPPLKPPADDGYGLIDLEEDSTPTKKSTGHVDHDESDDLELTSSNNSPKKLKSTEDSSWDEVINDLDQKKAEPPKETASKRRSETPSKEIERRPKSDPLKKAIQQALEKNIAEEPPLPSNRRALLEECPACGANMPSKPGVEVCPDCGFNTRTGAQTGAQSAHKPRSSDSLERMREMSQAEDSIPWFKKPVVLVGIIGIAAVVGISAFLMSGGEDDVVVTPPDNPPIENPVQNPPNTIPTTPVIPPVKPPKHVDVRPPDPIPTPPITPQPPPVARVRPDDINLWSRDDFHSATVEGIPKLLDALKLLVVKVAPGENLDNELIPLLEPARLHGSMSKPPVATPAPLSPEVLKLILNTLAQSPSPKADQTLENILRGKLALGSQETAAVDLIFDLFAKHPNAQRQKLLLACLLSPLTIRPAGDGPLSAAELQMKALTFLESNSTSAFRKTVASKLYTPEAAGSAPQLLPLLLMDQPQNIPAQVELYLSGRLDPAQITQLHQLFTAYGHAAISRLMLDKSVELPDAAASFSGKTVSHAEAVQIAQVLWQESFVTALWERIYELRDPDKADELRDLWQLSTLVPVNSARKKMDKVVQDFWKNTLPSDFVEGAQFGATWKDPGLWMAMKNLKERMPPPIPRAGKLPPPTPETLWFDASFQYLTVLKERMSDLSKARGPANYKALRPIALHSENGITAEYHLEWPQSLQVDLPSFSSRLMVHYIRFEERGSLEDRDRKHYYDAATPTKRRYLYNLAGQEVVRWLDGLPRETTEKKIRTVDVVITRTQPSAAVVANTPEPLIIEIFVLELDP